MTIGKTGLIFLFISATALSGCQSLDNLERENYQRACDNLGIQRGTPTYDECMLQQQRIENDNEERSMDRARDDRILKRL